MLLSIVECSDHRIFSGQEKGEIPLNKISNNIEVIGPVFGRSVAVMRNRGAIQARGRWVFFKDEDCSVDIDNLQKFIENLEKSPSSPDAVGGIYKSSVRGIFSRAYNFIQRQWVQSGLKTEKHQRLRKGDHLLGGALLVKKTAFECVGGFSETIGWGGEETEFISRLIKKGHHTTVSYRLIVEHNNKVTFFGFIKRAWWQNFNKSFYNISFSSDGNKFSSNRYFNSRWPLIPLIVLFFSVGSLATLSGDLARKVQLLR